MRKNPFQLLVVMFCVFFALSANVASAACASPASCRGLQNSGEPNVEFFMPCQKKYISLNDIKITDKGIFIQLGDHKVQTSTLFSDAQGLYVQDFYHLEECFAGLDVTCKGCGVCNASWQDDCRHCQQKLTANSILAKK